MSKLGIFARHDELSKDEQEVVALAWQGANNADVYDLARAYPVGAGILASNGSGISRSFVGCNVINQWFPASRCAEHNAAMTAVVQGYTQFKLIAVVCCNSPEGSPPCGICRQVLVQYGREAVVLSVLDKESSVRKYSLGDLLPPAMGNVMNYSELAQFEKDLARHVLELAEKSRVPYSKKPRAALFIAANSEGAVQVFEGISDDNASYPASELAETVAMRTARTAGFEHNVTLVVKVEDLAAVNPIEGGCLQVLREFAADAPIILVNPGRSMARTSLTELLPDAFGPDAL